MSLVQSYDVVITYETTDAKLVAGLGSRRSRDPIEILGNVKVRTDPHIDTLPGDKLVLPSNDIRLRNNCVRTKKKTHTVDAHDAGTARDVTFLLTIGVKTGPVRESLAKAVVG